MPSSAEFTMQDIRHCHFVICNQCYWCATELTSNSLESCRGCGSTGSLESIPLEPKEKFSLGFDTKRGLIVHFA